LVFSPVIHSSPPLAHFRENPTDKPVGLDYTVEKPDETKPSRSQSYSAVYHRIAIAAHAGRRPRINFFVVIEASYLPSIIG
jgi:hypothetical protein